jgi:mRNA interferase MazF
MKIKRGDIWLIDLKYGFGSEQGGVRPCLVVQNNIGNTYSPTTVICPITSKKKNFDATHVSIMLEAPSSIMCEQVRVVDTKRIKKFIGVVPEEVLREVEEKLKVTFAL